MTVETAAFISQLDATYPASGDAKSEGDNHLRLIKTAVKGSFPNLTALAVTATSAELNYVAGVTSAIQTQLNAEAATRLASDALKADLASPALTGTPTAPTAASTTSTTQIATTAMVQGALVAYSGTNLGLPTFSGADANKLLSLDGSGAGYVWSNTLTNKTLTGYTETVYALSGTVIDPANGTVQTKTLAANTTFTESIADGQSVVLMLNPATYTTTWPTTSWVNAAGTATAPTLKASVVNVVVLWQVAGTLYGNWIGSL